MSTSTHCPPIIAFIRGILGQGLSLRCPFPNGTQQCRMWTLGAIIRNDAVLGLTSFAGRKAPSSLSNAQTAQWILRNMPRR